MDPTIDQEVFIVPGVQDSKAERINKAFRKLKAKIEHLERNRKRENDSKAKIKKNEDDYSITDIQYQLLILQLRYVRSILRKKFGNPNITNLQSQTKGEKDRSGSNEAIAKEGTEINFNKETQTGTSLIYPDADYVIKIHTNKNSEQVLIKEREKNEHILKIKADANDACCTHPKVLPQSSKKHYHLNLDDVPFIIGTSASASHSVVANVQNIIGLMKTHNKALCGSRSQKYSQTSHPKTSSCMEKEDTNIMIKKLSRELSELAMKQEHLKQKFEKAENEDHSKKIPTSNENYNTDSQNSKKQDSKTSHNKHALWESSKEHMDIKKPQKTKAKYLAKKNGIIEISPVVYSSKMQPHIMNGYRMLRSLRESKAYFERRRKIEKKKTYFERRRLILE